MKLADGNKTTIQFTDDGLLFEDPDAVVVMRVSDVNAALKANPACALQMAVYHIGIVWEATAGPR